MTAGEGEVHISEVIRSVINTRPDVNLIIHSPRNVITHVIGPSTAEVEALAKAAAQTEIDQALAPYVKRLNALAQTRIYTLKLIGGFFQQFLKQRIPSGLWAESFQEVIGKFDQLGQELNRLAQLAPVEMMQPENPQIRTWLAQAEVARQNADLAEAERLLALAYDAASEGLRQVQSQEQHWARQTAGIRVTQAISIYTTPPPP